MLYIVAYVKAVKSIDKSLHVCRTNEKTIFFLIFISHRKIINLKKQQGDFKKY